MNESLNAWELLVENYPQLSGTIDKSIQSIFQQADLDGKTTQLIYIAVQAALNYPLAVKYHVTLAMEAGATRDEIVGAASIAAAAAGPKGFVSCMPIIMEQAEKFERDSMKH